MIVAVTVVFIQSVFLSWFLSKFNGSQSWLLTQLGNRLYTILVCFFMCSPMFMLHGVVFAMVTSTIDRMLEILEEFCDHIHSLVQQNSGDTMMVEEMGPVTHDRLYVKIRPKESSRARHFQELHASHLAEQFYAIQSLFLTYNRLIGSLLLCIIFTDTMERLTSWPGG